MTFIKKRAFLIFFPFFFKFSSEFISRWTCFKVFFKRLFPEVFSKRLFETPKSQVLKCFKVSHLFPKLQPLASTQSYLSSTKVVKGPSLYYVSIFWTFLDPTTHLISINTVLNVSTNGHFIDPPTQSFCSRNIGMAPKEGGSGFTHV